MLPRVLKRSAAPPPEAPTAAPDAAAAGGVVAPPPRVVRGAPRPDGPAAPPERPRVLGREAVATGGAAVSVRAARLAPPPAPAPEVPPAPPEPSADEVRAAAEAEAEVRHAAAVEAARAEGREAGLAAGRAAAEAEIGGALDALRAAAAADLDRLGAVWRGHHERVERQLVALAVEAADLLAAAPLSAAAREATDRAVVQALEGLADGDGLTVRLHPVDFLRLQEGGVVEGASAAYPALRWTPDDAYAEGDWAAASSTAVVRRVRTELLDGLRARLDLLQAAHDVPPSARPPRPAPPALDAQGEGGAAGTQAAEGGAVPAHPETA
ncbi:hypothetical protein RQM47_11815 [Rubrivirga sp. S365]|uniref:hypothetical protein n=1 Tax=Rubrivirga sp. S365 TaxID=3076080 RepID=UPI0028CA8A1A|nr:hypothetical protein [Rubrivirga sp. S365]MDT7857328.1 hypothetical protein [Rubrivirga sp. S365]